MINEDRVLLMTKLASYEQNEGKKNLTIGHYFRGDYVAVQVMKSMVYITVAFILCLAIYIFYDLENFTQNLYKTDIVEFIVNIFKYYAIVAVSYGVIVYAVSMYKYTKVRKSLKTYYQNLKKLNKMYEKQQ